MLAKIKSLHFYPLKSAKGIETQSLDITDHGPMFDREWMLVRENGQFISQRTHPKMALLSVKITPQHLLVLFENQPVLEIPLDNKSPETMTAKLFNKEVYGQKVGKLFDQWFSDFLDTKVILLQSPKNKSRLTSGNHGPKTPLHFADGYPLLMANTATLNELNSRLDVPVAMSRFRPNIVIETNKPDIEDQWQYIKINQLRFLTAKACTRCKIIDIDPSTGESNKTVSSELKKYRTKDNQVIFGMNLIHFETGTISVGDEIHLSE